MVSEGDGFLFSVVGGVVGDVVGDVVGGVVGDVVGGVVGDVVGDVVGGVVGNVVGGVVGDGLKILSQLPIIAVVIVPISPIIANAMAVRPSGLLKINSP